LSPYVAYDLCGSFGRIPSTLGCSEFPGGTLDYFRHLGHDNHRRLSKLYAWEEKKSKTSWGAQIVDYEKIAAAAIQVMKAADVNRFLVVCALISDLYCPGYNPRQPLAKDSKLARSAGRYKVDPIRIATAVRAEFCKKTDCHRSENKSGANSASGTAAHSKVLTKKARK